jgi:ATP-dependent protease ClpP protease subunit
VSKYLAEESEEKPEDLKTEFEETLVDLDDDLNIHFKGIITRPAVYAFQRMLMKLEKDNNVDAVHIYLSSDGGEAAASLFMYDLIRLCPKPVIVIVTEVCASGATIVLCGADHAVAHDSSMFMIHELIDVIQGQVRFSAMKGNQEVNCILMDKILTAYNKKTGPNGKIITEKELEKDWFFDSQTALKMGFIDEILENKEKEKAVNEMRNGSKPKKKKKAKKVNSEN